MACSLAFPIRQSSLQCVVLKILQLKRLQLLKSHCENQKSTPVYTVKCALNTACQEKIAIWD